MRRHRFECEADRFLRGGKVQRARLLRKQRIVCVVRVDLGEFRFKILGVQLRLARGVVAGDCSSIHAPEFKQQRRDKPGAVFADPAVKERVAVQVRADGVQHESELVPLLEQQITVDVTNVRGLGNITLVERNVHIRPSMRGKLVGFLLDLGGFTQINHEFDAV